MAAKKFPLTEKQIRENYLESDVRLYWGVDKENKGKFAIFEGDPPEGAWVLIMHPDDRVDFDSLERQGLSVKEFEKLYHAATGKTLENPHEVEADDAHPKKTSRTKIAKPRPMTAAKPEEKNDPLEDEAEEEESEEKEEEGEDEDLTPPSDQQGS